MVVVGADCIALTGARRLVRPVRAGHHIRGLVWIRRDIDNGTGLWDAFVYD
jgi:hypothetical protein